MIWHFFCLVQIFKRRNHGSLVAEWFHQNQTIISKSFHQLLVQLERFRVYLLRVSEFIHVEIPFDCQWCQRLKIHVGTCSLQKCMISINMRLFSTKQKIFELVHLKDFDSIVSAEESEFTINWLHFDFQEHSFFISSHCSYVFTRDLDQPLVYYWKVHLWILTQPYRFVELSWFLIDDTLTRNITQWLNLCLFLFFGIMFSNMMLT